MTSIDPVRVQDDLFRHVNGQWLRRDNIPPDQSTYGAFQEMRDTSEAICREIAEAAAAEPGPVGSPRQLIGDLYASFLDEELVESRGSEPAWQQLGLLEPVHSVDAFAELLGRLQREGVSGLFGFGADTDPDAPDRYTMVFFQGGLGLPDESYYHQDQYAEIRAAYREHVINPDAQRSSGCAAVRRFGDRSRNRTVQGALGPGA